MAYSTIIGILTIIAYILSAYFLIRVQHTDDSSKRIQAAIYALIGVSISCTLTLLYFIVSSIEVGNTLVY